MILELTPDQELFVKTTRRFLESEASTAHTRRLHEQSASFDPAVWRRGCELGWTSLLVPPEVGGGSISGAGLLDLALVAEEMGRFVSPGPLLSTNVVVEALARDDAAPAAQPVLDRLVAGEQTAGWAPHPGAVGREDDGVVAAARGTDWLLEGTAAFVLDAGTADTYLVTARTPGGLTQFLVPADQPGPSVVPRGSLDLVRRIGDLAFSQAPVPGTARVGSVDGAAPEVQRQVRTALVLQNAETVGALDRVFAFTLAYASDRVAFGRPVASYQAIKHRFADLKMWLEACHATAASAARAVATKSADADELVSVAKSYLADRAPSMIQECVQLHGGIGVTWEHDLHLYLRRVTQNAALLGDVRHHRGLLARRLGMPDR